MCKCTPTIRTPFCGQPGCEWPDNVVFPSIATSLEIPSDRIIQHALGKLKEVLIIGTTHDGEEYFAASMPSGPEALWLLQIAQQRLLEIVK